MSPEVKQFLQEHRLDLEDNNFNNIYKAISSENTSELTEVFSKANINPLEYMTKVPKNFLYACVHSIEGFKIPSNIVSIENHAFAVTDLTHIDIPEGVKYIKDRAFSGCSELKKVYLPSTIDELGRSIFSRCINLHTIVYNGTFEQFENIPKWDQWISAARSIDVLLVCKDKQEMVR